MEVIRIDSRGEVTLEPQAVLDVTAGQLLSGVSVTVRQGRITEVGAAGTATGQRVSLPGITLMPALIDCHVHLALDGVDFREALSRWETPPLWKEHLKQAAAAYLAAGVLAVRDGGDQPCIGLKAKQETGVAVITTGFAVRKDGFYGSFLGPGCRELREGLDQIRQLAALGVDQIKILVSGIVSFQEYGKVGPVQFSQAELAALVAEAHSLGLKVMAHASSDEAVRLAALAGVDSVEHGYFLSESSLELMAQKGIAWVPTVVPVAIWTEEPWRRSRSPEELAVLEKTYRLHLQRIKEAELMGVRLGIGTDAGAVAVPHGQAYYHELAYFQAAGLSPLACLRAATVEAAAITGAAGLGSIAPGLVPRLIGVRGNPLEDMTVLQQPACVILPEPGEH